MPFIGMAEAFFCGFGDRCGVAFAFLWFDYDIVVLQIERQVEYFFARGAVYIAFYHGICVIIFQVLDNFDMQAFGKFQRHFGKPG